MTNSKSTAQALSLIETAKLNAALVKCGIKPHWHKVEKTLLVQAVAQEVDKGTISIDEIRGLAPYADCTNIAHIDNTLVGSSAYEADARTVREGTRMVQDATFLARESLEKSLALRNEICSKVEDLSKKIDAKLKKIAAPDLRSIDASVQAEVGKLFKSLKRTITPDQLQTIADGIAVFEMRKASEIFPAPLEYEQDGEVINFDDLEVLVWHDKEACAVVDDYVFDPANLHQALCSLSDALPDNMWLAGERSTGKTAFCEQLSARLKRKLFRVNFDEAMERSEFIGANIINNKGAVEWKAGIIAQAISHVGSLVLLDEIGFARPAQLASLHALCERSANRAIIIAETGNRIPVASHVAFICADNSTGHGDPSGNFAGMRDQNSAFIDRFSYTLEFDFLPHPTEVALLTSRTGLVTGAADVLVRFANIAREKARAGILTQPPSLRQLIAWSRAVVKGVPVRTAFKSAIVNKFPADCEAELVGIFVAVVNVPDFTQLLLSSSDKCQHHQYNR